MPVLWLAVTFLFVFSAGQAGAANVLTSLAVGDFDDYSRLTFSFREPVDSYVVRRDDVDRVVVDFGVMPLPRSSPNPKSYLISQVSLSLVENRLNAIVALSTTQYELRHFVSEDKKSISLDFRDIAREIGLPADSPGQAGPPPLVLPPLSEVAGQVSLANPPGANDGAADNLFQRSLGQLKAGDIDAAKADLDWFRSDFPNHPANETASYLQAETHFLSGPPMETHNDAVNIWKEALEKWPQSPLASRGRFYLAEADRLAGMNNEAAAKFKIAATDALNKDDIYARLALLRAADLQLGMGLVDEARATVEPVMERGIADRLGLEAYARSGLADYYQGYFSQANESFRDILKIAPDFYSGFPEMLYALGEGYHYLERPDLSSLFLIHALNLMPEHSKADVILARIGDNYRKMGRDREAMAFYGAAQRRFPNGDGGMISQVRLADMGALHSFFSQDRVFDALERGSRQATVEMYKKIVDSASTSPLVQLAQLKIGVALSEDGENSEAVKWLRDIEINNPRSTLLPEAMPALNKALVNEFAKLAELGDYKGIADLYADNSSYINKEDMPGVQRLVAQSYEKLGLTADAREMWRNLEEQTPEKKLARLKALINSSMKMGRPLEAAEFLGEMENDFPGEAAWMKPVISQISTSLAKPRNSQATEDLLKMRDFIKKTEPARRDALSSAIEIEIEGKRYDKANSLMDQYRKEYPADELSPEYLLTQARIEEHYKRYDRAWDRLSEFRSAYPDDSRLNAILLNQIEKAEQLGRQDDAFRFMELYRGRFPKTAESRTMLANKIDRQWDLARYDDSDGTLREYLRDYPGDQSVVDLLIRQIDRSWDKGRFDQATALSHELLLNYPGHPKTLDYLINMAGREWEKERYAQAQALIEALLQQYPGNQAVGQALLKQADGNWSRGRFSPARQNWEQVRRAFEGDPLAGQTYVSQYRNLSAGGYHDEAFRLAENFRRDMPQETRGQADMMLEQAKDLLALGQVGDGIAMWNRFRETFPQDPRNADLLLVQARQELKIGRDQDALTNYRRFLREYPDNSRTPDVYLETAAAEAKLGFKEDAWAHLEAYRQLFPDHSGRPQAILDQADLGRSLGYYDQAVNLYRQFRQSYPLAPQAKDTYLPQARQEISVGRVDDAIATLEDGLAAEPSLNEDRDVQALLTELYLEDGRIEKWAALVEKNLSAAGNSPSADRFLKFNQLAQVYQELGQVANAERNFDSALANRPANVAPEGLYAIANAYKKMGRQEKYRATLTLLQGSSDPFWQKVVADELAGGAS